MTPTTTQGTAARATEEASLRAYVPTNLAPELWSTVREEAIALVLRAEPDDADRARKALELLADVVEHLSRTTTALTLDNCLADTTLASLDGEQDASGKATGTRKNKRGRFRRLQAAHRDLPWRRERRADGERIASLPQPEIADDLARLLPANGAAGRHGAGALQAALDHARRRRRGIPGPELEASVWASARRYARSNDRYITQRELNAVATYEVLAEEEPVSCMVPSYGLTRRDLDLALVLASRLPMEPGHAHRRALRG